MRNPASSPFSYLPAETLCAAYRTLTTADPVAPVSVTLDARAFGADVDSVTLTLRDLRFIHSLDATRFSRGDAAGCPICHDEAEAMAAAL